MNLKTRLITFIFISTGLLRAQVWTDMINTVNYSGRPSFYCTAEDTINQLLYIGGNFNGINGAPGNAIVQFDGLNFNSLATGLDDQFPSASSTDVKKMLMFQNKLYVFGNFAKAGPHYNRWMARWNGSSWDPDDFKARGPIHGAVVYNNELYVAGQFDSIGGIAANSIAKFDGLNWHNLNYTVKGDNIGGLAQFKGKLYIAVQTSAMSSAHLSYFNGSSWINWQTVSGGINRQLNGIKVLDTLMFVYGRFNDIGGSNCKGLGAFNGSNWFGFGQGISGGLMESVTGIEKINGTLYMTGFFDKVESYGNSDLGQLQTTNLAKFTGNKWCLISDPFDEVVNGAVYFKNNLYVYGKFLKYGIYQINGFVRWDGGNAIIGCSPTVSIFKSSLGIQEAGFLENLSVYPNPVNDKLLISFEEADSVNGLRYELVNQLGQLILSTPAMPGTTEINTSQLSQGLYYLVVKLGGVQKTLKIIKE